MQNCKTVFGCSCVTFVINVTENNKCNTAANIINTFYINNFRRKINTETADIIIVTVIVTETAFQKLIYRWFFGCYAENSRHNIIDIITVYKFNIVITQITAVSRIGGNVGEYLKIFVSIKHIFEKFVIVIISYIKPHNISTGGKGFRDFLLFRNGQLIYSVRKRVICYDFIIRFCGHGKDGIEHKCKDWYKKQYFLHRKPRLSRFF